MSLAPPLADSAMNASPDSMLDWARNRGQQIRRALAIGVAPEEFQAMSRLRAAFEAAEATILAANHVLQHPPNPLLTLGHS